MRRYYQEMEEEQSVTGPRGSKAIAQPEIAWEVSQWLRMGRVVVGVALSIFLAVSGACALLGVNAWTMVRVAAGLGLLGGAVTLSIQIFGDHLAEVRAETLYKLELKRQQDLDGDGVIGAPEQFDRAHLEANRVYRLAIDLYRQAYQLLPESDGGTFKAKPWSRRAATMVGISEVDWPVVMDIWVDAKVVEDKTSSTLLIQVFEKAQEALRQAVARAYGVVSTGDGRFV